MEKLSVETPNLKTFATLSPMPGFTSWLNEQVESRQDNLLKQTERKNLAKYTTHVSDADILKDLLPKLNAIEKGQQKQLFKELEAPLTRLAAEYICNNRNDRGRALDPVAHFHLSNGAAVYRLNWAADTSTKGKAQSFGLMVNYEYNLKEIQINSSAYEVEKKVAASSIVKNILKQ